MRNNKSRVLNFIVLTSFLLISVITTLVIVIKSVINFITD